jgi:hypothetical protein
MLGEAVFARSRLPIFQALVDARPNRSGASRHCHLGAYSNSARL